MLTVKEWMELVDYKITEGSEYCWSCFGSDAYSLSSWDGEHDGYSFNIVFDNRTQVVYTVEACDYKNNRAYRIINQDFKDMHDNEASARVVDLNEAWDNVKFVDLESDDDFIQKAMAIAAGESYSTDVTIPLDLTDEEMLFFFKGAHEAGKTFNQHVNDILREALENEDFVTRLKANHDAT
jgi:hypothetical protein